MANSGNSPGKAVETTSNGDSKLLLKQKILANRKSRGLGEIKLDFSPKKPQPLTADEANRLNRRRESNRRSAHLCRKKEKEQKDINEKLLQDEKSRNTQLLKEYDHMLKSKNELLHSLQHNLRVPRDVISQTLAAISFENKTLHSASDVMDEDQRSVFYLQNSENFVSHSEDSSSTFSSEGVEQFHSSDMPVQSYVTVVDGDVTTGSYVTSADWDSASLASSEGVELQIVEGENVENNDMDEREIVTVYVCFDQETSGGEERTYTNL